MYGPYIANAMLDAQDKKYFNMSGMLIYDPVIGTDKVTGLVTAVPFMDRWQGLFPFEDDVVAGFHRRHESCGYADFLSKYLTYPPPGPQPAVINSSARNDVPLATCASLKSDVEDAAKSVNPCFNIYHVTTTCPILWDVLGCTGP